MINWKSLVVASALITLPISAYAVQSHQEANSEFNNIQESTSMRHLAQKMSHGKRGGRGQHMDKLIQQLDLSPEQSEQIEAIQEESKAAAEGIKEQAQTQREEMKSLMASDASTAEIRTQYQEAQALRQEMSDNRFETMLRIREVLTSEQRAEIAELMEQHQERKSRNQ